MFNDPSVILTDLAAILKQPSTTALLNQGPFWTNLVSLTQATTYNDIVQTLLSRGYTIAQITAWDAGPTFERVLTAYNALVDNGILSQAGEHFIAKAERYLEALKTVTVTNSNATVDPLGTSDQVGNGPTTTSGDVFTWPGYDTETSLGQETKW